MATTDRIKLPIPVEGQDPWYEDFNAFATGVDSSIYAQREDRNTIVMGGGTIAFSTSTGVLSWDSTLELYSPITGLLGQVVASSVTLVQGSVLYVDLVRAPTTNTPLVMQTATQVPSSDTAFLIGIYRTDRVYFRNGSVIQDGESLEIFQAMPSGGNSSSTLFEWNGTDVSQFTEVEEDNGGAGFNAGGTTLTYNASHEDEPVIQLDHQTNGASDEHHHFAVTSAISQADYLVEARFHAGVSTVGTNMAYAIVGRYIDGDNWIIAQIVEFSGGSGSRLVNVRKRVGGGVVVSPSSGAVSMSFSDGPYLTSAGVRLGMAFKGGRGFVLYGGKVLFDFYDTDLATGGALVGPGSAGVGARLGNDNPTQRIVRVAAFKVTDFDPGAL